MTVPSGAVGRVLLSGMPVAFRCLIVLTAVSSALMADPLSNTLARMDTAARGFKSMTADIVDLEHTAVVNDDSTLKGTYKIRRNKGETRMLIEFTGAEAKSISLEGSQAKVYYPKINTEQVYNIGAKKSLVDEFLLLGFGASGDDLKASYDVTYAGAENIGGQPTSHIKLVPKSKDVLQRLKQAELWIADSPPLAGLPLQQKFTTSGAGDFKLVTYSNVKLNPSLSDRDLKLKTASGVQIQQMQQ
jgi:outer membrane lipoprotein-sorting protein